jgi:hypothetical protein
MLCYISIGASFAFTAWMEHAEIEIKKHKKYTKLINSKRMLLFFLLWWPVLMITNYRTYISRTTPDLQYFIDGVNKKNLDK